jgi:spermidine synthase
MHFSDRDGKPELLFDYNQRFLELLHALKPSSVLLIGGGAFTLPVAIAETMPHIDIDVVEPDALLYDLAQRYFGLQPSPRLQVWFEDGRSYLNRCKKSYDLILIDAFSHTDIPKNLITVEALQRLYQLLADGGVTAINIIAAYTGYRSTILRQVLSVYGTTFAQEIALYPAGRMVSEWQSENFVLVARKQQALPKLPLRYPPLESLPASEDMMLHDND